MNHRFPVKWANWGSASKLLAKTLRTHERPLLVMSIPRSGSSWVGDILGAAPNALYLREPINQSHLDSGGRSTIFYIDPHAPPAHLRACTHAAFSGLPVFRQGIVRDAQQWPLRVRPRKRVVIKEVNPLALPWFLSEYEPTVIFLVRHPAAVACSYRQLGWTETEQRLAELDTRLLDGPLRPYRELIASAAGFWRAQGTFQGVILRFVVDTLADYSDCKTITYEQLCADPETGFRELCSYARLEWDEPMSQRITERSSATRQDTQGAYDTRRDSRNMIDAWKRKVTPDQLAALHDAYRAFDLPFYNSVDDWTI